MRLRNMLVKYLEHSSGDSVTVVSKKSQTTSRSRASAISVQE